MARAKGPEHATARPPRSGNHRGRFERRSWSAEFGEGGRRARAASYLAFIPDPIADLEVRFSGETLQRVSLTESLIRELNADPPSLVSLEGLAAQLLRAEALASSAIEGLVLSHRRLARAAVAPEFDARAREVINNIRAMEDALALGRKPGRLHVADLQAIHATLAKGTRLAPWAGQLREEPGWIGGTTPIDASYVPPPHEYIPALLEDLVTFVNDRDELPPSVAAAIAHAQFETIHPFPDGNGRVGRCLIQIVLMRRGLAPRYVPPVSIALAARRQRYIDGLSEFEQGRIENWCAFFATAATDSARKARAFAGDVIALQAQWRERISARSDSAVWRLIDALPVYPVTDARTAQSAVHRSFQATNTALEVLERAGVLVRHDNRKRGRTWEAPELLDLLAAFETDRRVVDEEAGEGSAPVGDQ